MAFYPCNNYNSAIIAIDLTAPDVTQGNTAQGRALVISVTEKPRLCIGFYNWGTANQITIWDVANNIEYRTMPYSRPQNWSQGYANLIKLENNDTQVNFSCIASNGLVVGMVYY